MFSVFHGFLMVLTGMIIMGLQWEMMRYISPGKPTACELENAHKCTFLCTMPRGFTEKHVFFHSYVHLPVGSW